MGGGVGGVVVERESFESPGFAVPPIWPRGSSDRNSLHDNRGRCYACGQSSYRIWRLEVVGLYFGGRRYLFKMGMSLWAYWARSARYSARAPRPSGGLSARRGSLFNIGFGDGGHRVSLHSRDSTATISRGAAIPLATNGAPILQDPVAHQALNSSCEPNT